MLKNHFLVSLSNLFKKELSSLDELMCESTVTQIPLLISILNHSGKLRGKRTRALLLFLVAKQYGALSLKGIQTAAAIEFLHNATLLHDDVIDNNVIRRGVEAVNTVFSNKCSILGGDFLLAQSFKLLTVIDNSAISIVLSQAAKTIIEGEIAQLSFNDKNLMGDLYKPQSSFYSKAEFDLLLENYFLIIDSKTAALFACTAEVAAILSNLDIQQRQSWSRFGFSIGRAFQIIDDIIDYKIQKDVLGKSPGNDFFEEKLTLPMILLMKNVNEPMNYYWPETRNKVDFEKASNKMRDLCIFEEAKRIAEIELLNAKEILNTLKIQEDFYILINGFIEFISEREY